MKFVLKSMFSKKYWLHILGLFLSLIGQAVCEILIPISLVQLTQQANFAAYITTDSSFTIQTALNNTMYISLLMIFLCIGFVISGMSAGVLSSFIGSRVCADIRLKLYRKIQDLSFADLDNFKTSSLITRLTTDVEAIQNAMFLSLRIGLRSIFLFIGGLAGIVIIAFLPNIEILPMLAKPNISSGSITSTSMDLWYLVPLTLFVISAIMFSILMIILVKSSKQYKLSKYAIDETNSVMRENILGVRVVKSFNLQDNQIERFQKANENLRRISEKSFIISMWMFPIINIIMSWSVVLTIWIGAATSSVDVAKIGAVMSITTLLLFGMSLMINVIMQIGIALGSIKRVIEIFKTEPSIKYKLIGFNIEKPTIKFENVNFKYNETGEYVLKDINVFIDENETIGIIGATGSGKSTFVSLISRMYDVKEGNLSISGYDIKDIDKKSLRHEIAFSPQKVTLFSGTIASNLKYGKNDATQKEMEDAAKGAQAYDFIMQKENKFNANVEQRGRNFSGGQQQRISIARALIKKPKILILDSSTSALDMITEKKVNEYIKDTNKGRTTIVVSQRISGVKLADRILVFEKGKIVGDGSHIELLKNNPIYRDIAISQLGKEGVEHELK